MKEQEKKSHPSFGSICVSRVNGQTHLFGSDVEHHHFIQIEIHEAEEHRQLNQEWLFSRKTVAEVWLSEAQFAQMITSPNQGSGVACTIRYIVGDAYAGVKYGRPLPPKPEHATQKFRVEAEEHVAALVHLTDKIHAMVERALSGQTVKKSDIKVIKEAVESLRRNMAANANFILSQMTEHMEKTVAKAVAEFEGHMAMALERRGLQAAREELPLLLPAEKPPDGLLEAIEADFVDSGMEDIPVGGCEVMTFDEFINAVNAGAYCDDDGSGYYATALRFSRNNPALPSGIVRGKIDAGWTHVVWFNK